MEWWAWSADQLSPTPEGCSTYSTEALRFQEYSYGTTSVPLFCSRHGPCSVQKPNATLEEPGPPFVQYSSGSLAGSRCDSTNQKKRCVPALSPSGMNPE